MQFLSDDSLPQCERDRRATIRETIRYLEEQVENTWKHVEPELIRCVREGRYDAEHELRNWTHRETIRLRVEIEHLRHELPPYLEMDEGGWLVRIAVS